MSSFRRTAPYFCLAAVLCVAAPAGAGGPGPAVCDGISDVFPTSVDMTSDLTTVRVASGVASPVHVTQPPGDFDRLFIVEQQGVIRIAIDGVTLGTPFLDINSLVSNNVAGNAEEGLLSMAFHPDYQTNGHFFVFYTNNSGNQTIARYTVTGAPATSNVANPASAQIVITVNHPSFSNHNGGQIAFGPDGHLYIGVGDGGSACDPGPGTGNAQNLSSLLGKILRLNVDTLPYTTVGNPFVGIGAAEIWAYGMRNPYRFNFDRETGNILIGDVGQNAREELDCGNSPLAGGGGENYGWATHEGSLCGTCAGSGACLPPAYKPPIHEYAWFGGAAITGGPVYRGCRMSALHGHFFYSDYAGGFLRTLKLPAQQSCPASIASFINRTTDLAPGGGLSIASVSSFGEDSRGEVYIVDRTGGEVFKILPNLNIMEVSGPNAVPLTMGGSSWSWENLDNTVEHTFSQYKIYRSQGGAQGPFTCMARILANTCGAQCTWLGDATVPAPDQAFYYLITATGTGGETTAGAASSGTLRVVDTTSPCQ